MSPLSKGMRGSTCLRRMRHGRSGFRDCSTCATGAFARPPCITPASASGSETKSAAVPIPRPWLRHLGSVTRRGRCFLDLTKVFVCSRLELCLRGACRSPWQRSAPVSPLCSENGDSHWHHFLSLRRRANGIVHFNGLMHPGIKRGRVLDAKVFPGEFNAAACDVSVAVLL